MDWTDGLTWAAGFALAAWLYLYFLHGGFWRCHQRLTASRYPGPWPAVLAVVPARNEAEGIGETVRSILAQDYPGDLRLIVVDDASTDGTADVARAAATKFDADRLSVVPGAPLAAGWSGKLWAVEQGWRQSEDGTFVWLTDGDIRHGPETLRRLVAKAEGDGRDLVSLMVRLRCVAAWERFLVPAFVYFFQKLYPFPRVNDLAAREAAAAGGCILVRRETLAAAGGIAAIRGELIDDCALARLIKNRAAIWLGLGDASESLRPYDRLADVWDMVARTAYVQLKHSPFLLAGTVVGMLILYVAPPAAVAAGLGSGDSSLLAVGAAGWFVMAVTYLPTVRYYRLPAWRALTLPAAGALYTLMTLDSARRHYLGRGGAWKGRTYGADIGG